MFTAPRNYLLVIKTTNLTVPKCESDLCLREGMQGQVLEAEPCNFRIHHQFLGGFYHYYFKVQVSKTVSFFSLAFF